MCLVIELFMFCMNKLFKSVKLTCPCLTMNLGAIFYFHQILNISGYSIFECSIPDETLVLFIKRDFLRFLHGMHNLYSIINRRHSPPLVYVIW